MPDSFWTDPLMYQGGSDDLLAPRDPIPLADESWGCDLEAEVVVVTGDVPQGVVARGGAGPHPPGRPGQRRLAAQPDPGRTGQGLRLRPVQARLGPVAGLRHPRRARRPLARRQAARRARRSSSTASRFGRADAGVDMTFDFGTLIAHLAKTRDLGAGTIIGSGTVSNRDADGGPGKPVDRRRPRLFLHRRGPHGRDHPRRQAATPLPQARRHGPHRDAGRRTATPIFGAIEQTVVPG